MEVKLKMEQESITELLREYLSLKTEIEDLEEQEREVRKAVLALVKKQCRITPTANKSYTIQIAEGIIVQVHPKLKIQVVDPDKIPDTLMRNVKIKTTKSYTLNSEARAELKELLASSYNVIDILALLESKSEHVHQSLVEWASKYGLKLKPEYMVSVIHHESDKITGL